MEKLEKIGTQIFDKIRGQFSNITLGDENADSTQDPAAARFFNFNFIADGENFGNVTLSIIDHDSMKIYFSKNITSDLNVDQRKIWYEFLQNMRKFAMTNMLRFDTHDISRSLSINDVRNASKTATTGVNSNEVKLGEGRISKMYGTSKSSYQNFGPAKIIVRHSSKVDEEKRGSRSRKINSMFIENDQGERFKLPFTSVAGARAMANHIGAGGQVYDDIGKSISGMVTELTQLKPFLRRNKTATFEDPTTTNMIEAARDYFINTKKTLAGLKGKRGYQNYVDNFEPYSEDDTFDPNEYKERFTNHSFDNKTELALPSIHKAYSMKQQEEPIDSDIEELDEFVQSKNIELPHEEEPSEFEQWADEIVDENSDSDELDLYSTNDIDQVRELLSAPLPVGVDGINAIMAIGDVYYDLQLENELYDLSQNEGEEADATSIIKQWIEDNDSDLYFELGLDELEQNGDSEMSDEFDESMDIAALAGLAKGEMTKKGEIAPGEFGAFGRKPKGNDMRKGKFRKGPFGAKLALGEEGDEAPTPNQFPDTADGAKAFLQHMAHVDVTQATAYPDPEFSGVWKIENISTDYGMEEAIVYLPFLTDIGGDLGDVEMSDNELENEFTMESKAIYSDYKKAFESFNTPEAVIEHLEGRGMKCCINVAEQMATHLGLDSDVLAEDDMIIESIIKNAGIV